QSETVLAHAAWLGCSWQEDAIQTAEVLEELRPEWLIADHYAIDARWHAEVAPYHGKLLVIDDLADRRHLSDVLIDQTYARDPEDYRHCVSQTCRLLCGSQYALLRPEFAMLREQSLQRRMTPRMDQLLVTMGGVDKDN